MDGATLTNIASVATVLGSLVAVITLVVAVRSNRKGPRSELTYETLSTQSLDEILEALPDDFAVTYKGGAVRERHTIVHIRIENTGRRDLRDSDIHRPISITFPDGLISGADIIDTRPQDLFRNDPQVDLVSPNTLEIPRTLLNSGDRIDVSAQVIGPPHYSVSARIVGLNSISKRSRSDGDPVLKVLSRAYGALALFLLALSAVFLAGSIAGGTAIEELVVRDNSAVNLLVVGGYGLGFASVAVGLGTAAIALKLLSSRLRTLNRSSRRQ